MRKRQNHFGYVTPIAIKKLVVGPDNEEVARRIQVSEKVTGGQLNDKNIFQGSFDVFVYDYKTSTTSWFGFGDIPMEYNGLIFGNEVPANISACTGQDTSTDIIWGERLRTIFMVGFMIEPNLSLNAGA